MRVLIAIDGSAVSEDVLAAALRLFDERDEMHVLTVTNPHEVRETVSTDGSTATHTEAWSLGMLNGNVFPAKIVVRDAAESVTQAGARLHAQHLHELETLVHRIVPEHLHWQAHVVVGDNAPETILQVADELDVDGIAMGTRGRGEIASALLGSVAEEVIRHSSVPVLVVRQGMRVPRTAAETATPADSE